MSDQYTSNNDQKAFPGTLVDNSFKPENMGGSNQPGPGDTTSEGGHGGDPYSRMNQVPSESGQFAGSSGPYEDREEQAERLAEERFDQHAGEGVGPPNEEAGALAASSGTNEDARLSDARYVTADDPNNNIGA